MRKSIPFCVIDRPFVVWSDDVSRDRDEFLKSVDADFYDRAVRILTSVPEEKGDIEKDSKNETNPKEDDQSRKDISSFARLLWHHGIETLVMMLGAYIQAPEAVQAYFLKCRTEDAVKIADALLDERPPANHRLSDVPFNITNLLQGLHLCAGWSNKDDTIEKFRGALVDMLAAFTSEEHRWEYNSIKHGLRASHGRFALAVGFEETYGVQPPPEAMQTIGYSRDASFFSVARPFRNTTDQASRVNFVLHRVSVAWSLERVLYDLQLLSILIGNTVSALQIVAGTAPGTVIFRRPADAEEWWKRYKSFHAGAVLTSSFGINPDAKGKSLPTSDEVFDSYRRRRWNW